jgi:hypothetical protein
MLDGKRLRQVGTRLLSLLLIAAFLHYLQKYWRVVQHRRSEQHMFGAALIAVRPFWCLEGMDDCLFKTPTRPPAPWRDYAPISYKPPDPAFHFPSKLGTGIFSTGVYTGCFLIAMWFYNMFLKTGGFTWSQWSKATTKQVLPPLDVSWSTPLGDSFDRDNPQQPRHRPRTRVTPSPFSYKKRLVVALALFGRVLVLMGLSSSSLRPLPDSNCGSTDASMVGSAQPIWILETSMPYR